MDKDLSISIGNMQNAVERDSIVLARMPEFKQDDKKWVAASFDRMKENGGRKLYLCSGVWYLQCIPYHLNEEILATEDNPKDLTHLSWGMDCLFHYSNKKQIPFRIPHVTTGYTPSLYFAGHACSVQINYYHNHTPRYQS